MASVRGSSPRRSDRLRAAPEVRGNRVGLGPSVPAVAEGDLEGVRLEIYDDRGAERTTIVAASRDPRLLEEVLLGLHYSVRRVHAQEGGVGCDVDGRLFLQGTSHTVPISLTLAGFTVGERGAYDKNRFYSPRLAIALDRLLYTERQQHLDRELVAAFSYPEWLGTMLWKRPSTLEELLFPGLATEQDGKASH